MEPKAFATIKTAELDYETNTVTLGTKSTVYEEDKILISKNNLEPVQNLVKCLLELLLKKYGKAISFGKCWISYDEHLDNYVLDKVDSEETQILGNVIISLKM